MKKDNFIYNGNVYAYNPENQGWERIEFPTEKEIDNAVLHSYPCWDCKQVKEQSFRDYLECQCSKLVRWKKDYRKLVYNHNINKELPSIRNQQKR